jgi:hypothetical protein
MIVVLYRTSAGLSLIYVRSRPFICRSEEQGHVQPWEITGISKTRVKRERRRFIS